MPMLLPVNKHNWRAFASGQKSDRGGLSPTALVTRELAGTDA